MASKTVERYGTGDEKFGTSDRPKEIEDSDYNSMDVDLAAERRALRKVDWHILPMIFLLYMFSFIDRSNIGNGRLYGLEKDLGLKGDQFQTAISLFYATYITCEVPCTIFLKKLRPARFISGMAICWGIIASLTGLTNNYASLIACRLLLGLAEGPLFPSLVVYMTLFYTRKELAVRFGYLVMGAALAGAVGGLLAYAVGYMDGTHGMRAWRWLLIIEGIPSVVLGIFGCFFLADSPESAWYLSPDLRRHLLHRSAREEREASTTSAQTLHRSDVQAAVKDWKVWAFCLLNFPGNVQLFTYAIFLPTIIKAINPAWSSINVQALTVPCFAWSAVVYMIVAYISDAVQHRAAFALAGVAVSILGHVLLIVGQNVATRYAGCFVIATGLFVLSGIVITWLPTNLPRYGKRSTAVGMQLMIGNCAGVAAPFLYPTPDSPRFVMGHAVTIALLGFTAGSIAILWWAMVRINKRREAGDEDAKIVGLTQEETDGLGDDSPRYRYAT